MPIFKIKATYNRVVMSDADMSFPSEADAVQWCRDKSSTGDWNFEIVSPKQLELFDNA